ncbi:MULTISPECIES: dephospho-CoA kinase [unclassified Helicobacter]|uniref:dephospho-CoA kinase n=1 Tax=unclassified Helicobacter TaxID=2593540 RepID=UPI001EEA39E3|nr:MULTISPECIES: dephospho-CoA kinase [unclassified Helicobacter]
MLEYGVALTGGIASGKSCVVDILREKGFVVIDADEIAHQAFDIKKESLREAFNLKDIQEVNRRKIGEIVFADSKKRKILESILHPIIKEMILLQSYQLEQEKKIYFLDIPLFFEVGGKKTYEVWFVALVFCEREVQLQRLCKRNAFSKEEAIQRIQAQIPLNEKIPLSDYVIDNSKGLKELEENVDIFLKYLSKKHRLL